MDVFGLRDNLIREYRDYVSSFVKVRDDRVREKVDSWFHQGRLWPDPMVGLNPTFATGGSIDDLTDDATLHHQAASIFRARKSEADPVGKAMTLYQHQVEAIHQAKAGSNYVLTTGTGSGKSLAYIVPIVDYVLRNPGKKGIKAIIVYPMNALANSQEEELRKFLDHGVDSALVRFARYTGQEDEERRKEIQDNPPDIILTNYVMLELILTRIRDKDLVKAAEGLRFLVLDELHTYRGRQGADVGLLVRRLRYATKSPDLQAIGTSATLASGGSWEDQRSEVARVASLLFGAEVRADNIVGETLERATAQHDFTDPGVKDGLVADIRNDSPPTSFEDFVGRPLAAWIEQNLGVTEEDGRLVRATPRSIVGAKGVAKALATLTNANESSCRDAIERWLLAGHDIIRPDGRFNVFAFRLHQFISKGDTVYAAIDRPSKRFISLNPQTRLKDEDDTAIFPLVFCRACGQDYYSIVRKTTPTGETSYEPTALADQNAEEDHVVESGYLMVAEGEPWPSDTNEAIERLPDEWKEVDGRVKAYQRKLIPQRVFIGPNGHETDPGTPAAFIKSPFRFCLACGISYGGRIGEFSKLGTLGSEGRSTATTLLTMSAIRQLRAAEDLSPQARKVLSFTDNRQDASLQAGHFNDFVQVVQQRGALLRALQTAGEPGLRHDELPQRVFDALGLDFEEYARTKDLILAARDDTNAAFRNVIEYRVYNDLQRGWRLTAPNLEQCGLLEIDYQSLRELCDTDEYWSNQPMHPALLSASSGERYVAAKALLDWMRRELAISSQALGSQDQEQLKRRSTQLLEGSWALDENEKLNFSRIVFPRSRGASDDRLYAFLSGRGAYGNYLRRHTTFPAHGTKINVEESEDIIRQLLALLKTAGLVVEALAPRESGDLPGYQLSANTMIWKAGDGTHPFHDPIRVPHPPEDGGEANEFFVDLYSTIAAVDTDSPEMLDRRFAGMEAAEHTAQVRNDDRQERETRFRSAELPLLFCSPTMELGVDISDLNVVNMRNVPPTPANYAQRSGRAGRSGQPALVFTYCSKASQHDQYFFRRPELMVSGQVTPPRLDLANEDLVKSHVYALWLTESGLNLQRSLVDVLELSTDPPGFLTSVEAHLDDTHARSRALAASQAVLADLDEPLTESGWWSDDWLDRQLGSVRKAFELACTRWLTLYTAAKQTADRNHAVAQDPKRSKHERDRAERIRREAVRQLDLLFADDQIMQSDFYSYRYFATEGFLPGYSFPRLPLSAFIPGAGRDGQGRFVSRPRFLAISEFGPRSIIYHEGARFQIDRVILPAHARSDPSARELDTETIKRCTHCGYLHHVNDESNPDLCERCEGALTDTRKGMFRLENVSTRRRQRINSDEEERQRRGFEIETAVRFSARDGKISKIPASVNVGSEALLQLTYGDTADIWRVNLGERRRQDVNRHGFLIDVETGAWARTQTEEFVDPDSPEAELKATQRVIPYVHDTRNCLIVEPTTALEIEDMATLGAALKNAVQAVFQLEDQELMAEPLPTEKERSSILLVEAAEGGAGVLRRLVDEPDAVARVATEALRILHFDTDSGNDMHWPPGADAEERCSVACYDCLLSYRNQMDHLMLDRHLIVDLLLSLRSATTVPTKQKELRVQSTLEQRFLDYLDEHGLRRPDDSQVLIEAANTRVDFLYSDTFTVVFIDGPVHDFDDRVASDKVAASALRDLGYSVVRFRHDDDWPAIVGDYPDVFGALT